MEPMVVGHSSLVFPLVGHTRMELMALGRPVRLHHVQPAGTTFMSSRAEEMPFPRPRVLEAWRKVAERPLDGVFEHQLARSSHIRRKPRMECLVAATWRSVYLVEGKIGRDELLEMKRICRKHPHKNTAGNVSNEEASAGAKDKTTPLSRRGEAGREERLETG